MNSACRLCNWSQYYATHHLSRCWMMMTLRDLMIAFGKDEKLFMWKVISHCSPRRGWKLCFYKSQKLYAYQNKHNPENVFIRWYEIDMYYSTQHIEYHMDYLHPKYLPYSFLMGLWSHLVMMDVWGESQLIFHIFLIWSWLITLYTAIDPHRSTHAVCIEEDTYNQVHKYQDFIFFLDVHKTKPSTMHIFKVSKPNWFRTSLNGSPPLRLLC